MAQGGELAAGAGLGEKVDFFFGEVQHSFGMQLQATVLDGVLTLSSDKGSVSLEPQRWQ